MKFLILILFISSAYAQTFVTEKSITTMGFEGTFLSQGKNEKGIITVRNSHGSQMVLIVNEIRDFRFPTLLEEQEFNDEFMESQYFPQIRISGKLKEKVDLTKDGLYLVHFTGNFTMRSQTIQMELPVRMEIESGKMTFVFQRTLDLTEFYVPYAGAGSDIGRFADYIFEADLKRTH